MRLRFRILPLLALVSLALPSTALAGMPVVTLSDVARMRVQAISFFAACFLACAWVIQRTWNSLREDVPRLPRLSYRKALGIVTLWGLLFLLVLTMISGARELMTPGAWRKEGYISKLNDGPVPSPEPDRETERRQGLERLRVALRTYAGWHGGRFPQDDAVPQIPEEVWRVPDPSGIRYVYAGGQEADGGSTPLAWEPGIFGKDRMVLSTGGAIRRMTSEEIRSALKPEVAR